jgi:hypothetical protein
MQVHPIAVALVLVLLVGVVGGVRQLLHLRRALRRECAVGRLTAAAHHGDVQALSRKVQSIVWEREVLAEADLVLDSALAVHHRNSEGGPG